MPETTSNVEFAHRIHESSHSEGGSHSHRGQWVEILEAVVLAAVAVLTASRTRPNASTSRAVATRERGDDYVMLAFALWFILIFPGA